MPKIFVPESDKPNWENLARRSLGTFTLNGANAKSRAYVDLDQVLMSSPGNGEGPVEFEEIIGTSAALKAALQQVERVAPTDSTVLILGETGTGKELIARAVLKQSQRCSRPFVKLNCAAIPFDLLESELFGHERGAFTGAIEQKMGRFEMADTGTLFLDEIGDIPLALQPKLLRVLQEQEFERLGSGRTHKIDVRLVAATHQNLAKMVAHGEFRSDLYYRLNVFPISLPPLRARSEDIPALVEYFVGILGRRIGKRIDSIPSEIMAAFQSYSWPGNIRELQNLVERAVILADDGLLANPISTSEEQGLSMAARSAKPTETKLTDIERTFILKTLDEVGWRVGGPNGAAARLGLKRTTLIAKMKKLQITRPAPERPATEVAANEASDEWKLASGLMWRTLLDQ
jgi:transcriptional regulator with GAF, ATPase, and Fis domain